MISPMSHFPSKEDRFCITGPAGRLELLGALPKKDLGREVAVICHPHPQFQGSMHNKVVTTLAKVFHELGMPTLRFNFRGVGDSDGEFGEGLGELEDTLAVIQIAKDYFPNRRLVLSGFSFGGAIAIEASVRVPTSKLVLVAPSIRTLFTRPKPVCPMIVAQGEADDVIDPQAVYEYCDSLSRKPTLIKFADTGHFFHGQLIVLRDELLEVLREA